MCGIVAVITARPDGLGSLVAAMNETLRHRGPDAGGLECAPERGVALAMRRLSIVDLAGGHQPMWDERREHAVVFNGEVYNAAELRCELVRLGHRFATDHSDTEVVVHGFEEWGTDVFGRLEGMFGLAVWDTNSNSLVVARDRAGEKPVYIAQIDGGHAVASELKALLRHPAVSREIDPVALEQYLSFDFALAPRTMLRGVSRLPAGHYAVLTADRCEVARYWEPDFTPRTLEPEGELVDRLDRLLDSSVRARMVADVPVGLFLSGGLDSTTVGYYMRRHSPEVVSFSIGFDDAAFDETAYAALAARHLGTAHHVEVLTEGRVLALVPAIVDILDEPMADQSILPTHLLSATARRRVKVALGGDGSDELLMGYRAYRLLRLTWPFDRLPRAVGSAVASAARRAPARLGGVTLRGKRLAERLDCPPGQRLLATLGSFHGSARWVLSPELRRELPAEVFDGLDPTFGPSVCDRLGPAQATSAAYFRGYLQEDILVKVDRASMAASLEVRAPFLDSALISFLAGLPPRQKLRGATGKHLLRRLMRGRIPDQVIDRSKQGFGVPLSAWLRGALRPLTEHYLGGDRLRRQGWFDPVVVGRLVVEHVEGRRDHGQLLWPLLLFEMWHERWVESSGER